MGFFDDNVNLRKTFANRPAGIPKNFATQAIRDELRNSIDPVWVRQQLVAIVEDERSSRKDKLIALKMIMDRRDGMPTGVVVTAHASFNHALADASPAMLDQLDKLLTAQVAQASISAYSFEGDADYCEPEEYIDTTSPDDADV